MSSPSDSDTTPSATLNDLIAVAIDNLQLGYSLSWSFVRDGVTSRPPLRVLRAPPPDNSAETGTTPGPGLPFNGGNSVNVGGDAAPFPGDQQVSRSRFLITCLRRVGRPRTFQVGDAVKTNSDEQTIARSHVQFENVQLLCYMIVLASIFNVTHMQSKPLRYMASALSAS